MWSSLAGCINQRVKNVVPNDPDLSGETLDFCGTGYRQWRPAAREQQPQHCHKSLDRLEAARKNEVVKRAVVETMNTLFLTQTLKIEILE
jgi:hypothetical protein